MMELNTSDSLSPILIVGAPRSGTTWIGRALGRGEGRRYVHEPDNERLRPYALRAKRRLGRFPVLEHEDEAPSYLSLFRHALDGDGEPLDRREKLARKVLRRAEDRGDFDLAFQSSSRDDTFRMRTAGFLSSPGKRGRSGSAVVVKSVHCALSIEWIYARLQPQVLVILRHPFSVLASYAELQRADQDRRLDRHPRVAEWIEAGRIPPARPEASPLARAAWQLGVLHLNLESAVRRNPQWTVVTHEAMCTDPPSRFRTLAKSLGLSWTPEMRAYLEESNRSGIGFAAERVAAEQPQRWRTRLSGSEVSVIRSVLDDFSIQSHQLKDGIQVGEPSR